MAWIMRLTTSKGHRYCNQICWYAKGDNCHCICGGKNHKTGLDNVRLNMETLWKDFKKANEGDLEQRAVDDLGKPLPTE